jgi:hypothetical protein
MKEPKIGDYYSQCCLLDLYQIQTAEDLAYVEEMLEDREETGIMIFPDLDSAFKQLSGDFPHEEEEIIYNSLKAEEIKCPTE